MTDDEWRALISAFLDGRMDAAAFHDGFLAAWRAQRDAGLPEQPPIYDLFFTVEAFCPDPALRNPECVYEAAEDDLRRDAASALARFDELSRTGNATQ